MTHIRKIYGNNFRWQHTRYLNSDAGGLTVERYRARCKIKCGGFWPGRYAKLVR